MKFIRFFIALIVASIFISSCQKDLAFEIGDAAGALVKDASGDCTPVLINGSYKSNIVLDATNYVDVQINITQLGAYTIKTDTVNGYSFSATGNTGIIGINTIRLIGSGKPLVVGFDVFKVKFGTSICEFNVVVTLGTGGGTAAVFTLNGSPTSCTGFTQTSNFFQGLPVTVANTVTVFANVTSAGSYTINATTTPANGVTFAATGNLAVGTNIPIVLTAVGTSPSAAGSIPYTLSTTSPVSNCGFNLTVQAALAPAVFTFNCGAASVQGLYEAGSLLTAANFIRIPVTVATGGTYNLTTAPSINGVIFSGTGVLTTAPGQFVTLFASTTVPAVAGLFNYTITGNGVSCGPVAVTYTVAGGGGGASTDSISCTINNVFKLFDYLPYIDLDNTSVPGYTILAMGGDSTSVSSESIGFGAGNLTGIIPTNIPFTVNQGPAILVGGQYTDNNAVDYLALTGNTNPTPAFTVTITSITGGALGNPGTRVKGTFSGAVIETAPGTAVKTITGGYFDLTF